MIKRIICMALVFAGISLSEAVVDAMSIDGGPGNYPEAVAQMLGNKDMTVARVDTLNFISSVANCITPQMFGAKGDGKADDTNALRKALYQSDKLGRTLYFPAGYKYYVTGSLNYYENKYRTYTLNIIGPIPYKLETAYEKYGGILMAENVSLFKNASFTGSIKNVAVNTKKRSLNTHFFDNCECRGFCMIGCAVMNLGTMFYDSSIRQVSQITSNSFWSVYYFARNEKTSAGCIDSNISFNYINGGQEVKDNVCFEWGYFNGSNITNNFIDYYRTIYQPKAVSKQEFIGPVSSCNQYQVFRYLYYPGSNITTVTFYSNQDCFNWNDPDKLEHLAAMKPITYKGADGKIYDVPPFVAMCSSKWMISVKGAKVELNMKSLVFVESSISQYKHNYFEAEFVGNNPYSEGQISFLKGGANQMYNGGNYLQNTMKISGIIEESEKLPEFRMNWTESVPGRKVIVDGQIYRAENVQEGKKWKAAWVKE